MAQSVLSKAAKTEKHAVLPEREPEGGNHGDLDHAKLGGGWVQERIIMIWLRSAPFKDWAHVLKFSL